MFSFVRHLEWCSHIVFSTFLFNSYIDIVTRLKYFLERLVEFAPPKCYYIFIGKTYTIDNYQMTNVFNMLDHLLTNIIYISIQR